MEGSRGWVFAKGEGGAVICITVLKARRNWRAERLLGKTYRRLEKHMSQHVGLTYRKEIVDIEGEMLGS